jgi:hypothetical protein
LAAAKVEVWVWDGVSVMASSSSDNEPRRAWFLQN